jgi:methyltransferase (TIGR00027 family)
MRPGRASKTAEHNALFRALETRRPEAKRLIDDPLAGRFLSPGYRALAALARVGPVREALIRIIDRRFPGVRSSVVARTRLIDEAIAELVPDTPQFVILGAGFDSRAWRLDCLRGVAVFEVDHPETQRTKRAALERAHVSTESVRFVPTDFHLGRLDGEMTAAGYDPATPTLFLWEGTTNYLSAETVDATLRWLAHAEPRSQLIFTYINRDVLDDPSRYEGAERVLATIGNANEPMTFGLEPDELGHYLTARGLHLVSDIGCAAYRERYYGAAAMEMRGHEFYRVAHATMARATVTAS